MKRTIHLILFLLLLFSMSKAQEYYARHYSVYDGLPSPEIYDFAQDSLGRMLFVTRGGFLISYDGFQWKQLTPHIKNNAVHGTFGCVFVDQKGIIWGADFNAFNGIYYYRDNHWKLIPLPDSYGFGSTKPLKIRVIYKNNQPIVLLLLSNNNLLLWRDKKFLLFHKKNSPFKQVQTFLTTGNELYILDRTGLFKLKDESFKRIPLPPEIRKENFYGFCTGPSNNTPNNNDFYFLTTRSIAHWVQNKIEKIPLDFHPEKLASHLHYKMISDGFGGVFVGSSVLLKHYNAYLQKWEDIKLSKEYTHIGVTDIQRDRENNYWIATTRGIFKIPSLRFLNFSYGQHIPDEITSIREFSPGRFLFASSSCYSLFDGSNFKCFKLPSTGEKIVRILTSIKDPFSNNIIAAAQHLGVIIIKPNGKRTIVPSPSNCFFNCIIPESGKKNSFLIGTSEGLWRLTGNRITELDIPTLRHRYIRRIYRDKKNTLFLGTIHNGIYKIPDGSWDKISQIKNASSCANNIYAINGLGKERILVGTYNGLYEIRSDTLIPSPLFTEKIPIFSIMRDKNANIWLGTDRGVYVLHGPHKISHFDVRNGLGGMECNRDALFQDSQGRIWIGTNNGLSLYQPPYDHKAPTPIVRILNTPPQNKSISFKPTINGWAVKLLCTSFKDERHITLRYRLKGWEDWRLIPNIHSLQINYWHLLPGTYQFQVQARNVEGSWSPIVESPTFEIPTPIWRNFHFLFFTAIILITLIYFLIYGYYKNRLNKKLAEEIKERTRALKNSEAKYRQLFMSSLDGIFITTPAGKFVDVNPAGIKLFGYDSKEELLQVDIPKDLYVNPKDRERFKREIAAKGHVHNFEIEFKRKDGKIFTAVLSSTCEYDDQGNVISYNGYIRDITEWKEMKQRLAHSQRMESLGLLAGGIAHDFNNILAGILGYASLMKMRMKQDDKLYRYVEIIEQSAQRAAELTNQLLIFSRRGQTKLTAINVKSAIDEALKIISSTFPKSIEINVAIEKDLPEILADPTQMQQIIINLAVNARDALPDGEGKIRISAHKFTMQSAQLSDKPEAKAGEYVCLKISDNGTGIPDGIKEKVFEPFFSTKPKGKGTGMGLAMVYGAVRNLGGFVQLQSEVNKGTTFSLYFPVRTIEEDESVEAQNSMTLEGDERILVVDDEEMVRNFCQLALERYGYRVTLAENGKKAIEIFEAADQPFDLVVLDMIMPVLDGVKTYKKIRKVEQSVHFLISSGYSDSDKLEMLKKDPLVEVIFKPYKAKELVKTVREILNAANDVKN